MSNIVFCGVAPHPPILLPEVGGSESAKVSATFAAMEKFAEDIKNSGAEVIVIFSPHGSVSRDGIAINGATMLKGDLRRFRADLSFEYSNDLSFLREIIIQSAQHGILALEVEDKMADNYGVSNKLDYGVLVPMYFLDKAGIELPVVSISMAMLPFEELYAFGTAVKEAADRQEKKVAIIASGDMSHRLIPSAPGGYSPEGEVFDRQIVELIKAKDFKGIINIDKNLAEEAGECGLRTIIMMLGALDGDEADSEVYSYEGPFGVGYMVAVLKSKGESVLVSLARRTLEAYVRGNKKIVPDLSADAVLSEKAGVFVSLKKHGQLRGCIGTIMPTTANVGSEIVNNVISAGTRDPRFDPVEAEELDDLVYSVDVLQSPEPINSIAELDVKRYGVIVRSGRRSGLLLPNLDSINTPEQQVAIARQKGGIGPEEPVQLERFEVVRYH
jgi:AmmeMemoRadiSam system protein A